MTKCQKLYYGSSSYKLVLLVSYHKYFTIRCWCVSLLDDKVSEATLWELFLQAGPVIKLPYVFYYKMMVCWSVW